MKEARKHCSKNINICKSCFEKKKNILLDKINNNNRATLALLLY